MNQSASTEAESFHYFLTAQIANGGRNKSPEELVETWRREQQELHESVAAVRAALDNMNRGTRGTGIEETARELRQHFGWADPS